MTTVHKPTHILLLEDEGLVRAGLKALLNETLADIVVYEAASYAQALAILQEVSVDFAFLDFKLATSEGKTGLDVLHFMQTQGLATPAFILSAGNVSNSYMDKDFVLQCLLAGAAGYIPKAMEDVGVLRAAIENAAHGRFFLSEAFVDPSKTACDLSNSLADLGVKGRALEVLYFICQGDSNKAIAERLQLVEGTVRDYVSHLLKCFAVKNRTQLLLKVARMQLIIPRPEDVNG